MRLPIVKPQSKITRTNKTGRYSVLFFVIVFFIFIEGLIISPRLLERPGDEHFEFEKLKTLTQQSPAKTGIEQKMLGVHYVENSANSKGWELFATEASGTADSQWVLKKVRVQFFTNDNSSFVVTGDVGEVDGATKDMIVRGNVKTTSSNGYSFSTASLRYLAKTKQMSSQDAVEMLGPPDGKGTGFKLNGIGLLVDIVKNKMMILDQVVAEKVIEGKNFLLRSKRAEFSNHSHEALFSGSVRMRFGDSYAEAPNAYFKYSNQTKALQTITLYKNVRMKELDRTATCEELEYDLDANKMTLRGKPKVIQGDDEITGHEISFLDGGKKVKINKVGMKGKTK